VKAKELCEFNRVCPVYKGEVKDFDSPLHVLRNVFCNRGSHGWNNCARYSAYLKGDEVPEHLMPFEK